MRKTHYIIVSTDEDCNPLYWDVAEWEWTPERGRATRFDKRILSAPLPEGAGAVLERDEELNTVSFHPVANLPEFEFPI